MKRAKIYIDDIFCGILTEAPDGYYFKYDEQYMLSPNAKALSPTMPLQTEEYEKEMKEYGYASIAKHKVPKYFLFVKI